MAWYDDLAKGVTGVVGGAADEAGTFIRKSGIPLVSDAFKKDWGVSEMLSGGNRTANTGQVATSLNSVTKPFYNMAASQPAPTRLNTPTAVVDANGNVVSNNNAGLVSGGGVATKAKVLDTAGLQSLDSLIASYDTLKSQAMRKAALARDDAMNKKKTEKELETGKYSGKKLSTLQDFSGAKTDTDLNTRNTLENLVSSLSTLGLGGSRALTRQILDAANMANRKANATQAKDNQSLDSAYNEYTAGNENDMKKISDQFGYDTGEAEKDWGQKRQTALYKKAGIYADADKTAERESLMNQGNDLNSIIANSAFMNPSYTGETKTMAAPDLGTYTQDIAKYDTAAIGAEPGTMTPAGNTTAPGNLAIKAIALNDKDLGIKKKTEGDLGYGV